MYKRQLISITLLYQNGNNVIVQTNNKGSFMLSADLNSISLYYDPIIEKWLKLNLRNTSMFPTVFQTKLTYVKSPPVINMNQGWSVSLSADGNTLASGSPEISLANSTGYVYIWIRPNNGSWAIQQQIIGDLSVIGQQQGYSVSLSGDGNTLAFGGIADNTNTGAVWIFTRSSGIWTQQGGKLVGTVSNPSQYQGCSVSLSSNGNTLAFGGYGDTSNTGAVWVFTRSNSIWTQQQKLIGTPTHVGQKQASSVALSADGNTIAFGAGENASQGATWIWTRSNNVWLQESKLIGTGLNSYAQQGTSVSLSADGNTVASGCVRDNTSNTNNTGSVLIFSRIGTLWTQQINLTTPAPYQPNEFRGWSVSLSANGNTVVSGGPFFFQNRGAVYIYN